MEVREGEFMMIYHICIYVFMLMVFQDIEKNGFGFKIQTFTLDNFKFSEKYQREKGEGKKGGGDVELRRGSECSGQHDQLEAWTRHGTPQACHQDPCHRWTIQLKNR